MDDPSIRRVGAIACLGVALAYLLTAVCGVLMPPELQGRSEILVIAVGLGGFVLVPAWFAWAAWLLRGRAAPPGGRRAQPR